MKTRKWQDQQGQDRYTTELIADNAQPYPKADLRGQQSGQQSGSYEPGAHKPEDDIDPDPIPFAFIMPLAASVLTMLTAGGMV
jgi:single-stranded DNA-binding protein